MSWAYNRGDLLDNVHSLHDAVVTDGRSNGKLHCMSGLMHGMDQKDLPSWVRAAPGGSEVQGLVERLFPGLLS
jgi:hypothetical protein